MFLDEVLGWWRVSSLTWEQISSENHRKDSLVLTEARSELLEQRDPQNTVA